MENHSHRRNFDRGNKAFMVQCCYLFLNQFIQLQYSYMLEKVSVKVAHSRNIELVTVIIKVPMQEFFMIELQSLFKIIL